MTFKLRPYQALVVAALHAHGRAAQPVNPGDDLLSQRLPISDNNLKAWVDRPGTTMTVAPSESVMGKTIASQARFLDELRALLDEQERQEQARIQRDLTFLRSVEHIKSPDPRVDWHRLGAGPFFWSRAFAEWWHSQHPGLGLPLNVRVHGRLPTTPPPAESLSAAPRRPRVLLVEDEYSGFSEATRRALDGIAEITSVRAAPTLAAPLFLTVPMPQHVPPQETRPGNQHRGHLARGAQWKRETGRRR